ncbi:MFS transporter [Prevotella sp.]|jgi:MFS transporter, PAT family, beta-lactamase induction signal transducer AmpG|uniref:MFS transporter n=1 Tax=Prevotella sp. TaxID=59823 RepID=UPI0025D73600|nr:MFS transporter [Prevotella sp.]MCI6130755.1 MFS transporter [Prevotella sp.]MDY3966997.1 MFS transporter [Prevotella sp.]
MEPNKTNGRSPISWVPTLYFAMGMPFVVLNMVCVLMFKGLDVSDAQIALWTSIIMFPWTLKPLWSPLLEMYKTKKFFVIVTQIATGCIFGLIALALHLPDFFAVCIALLSVIALSGATHDVAADGVYMASLSKDDQARYIGWQGAFYNIAKIAATGGLVMLAGVLIKHFTGDVSTLDAAAAAVAKRQGTVMAWTVIMAVIGVIMVLLGLYNAKFVPADRRDTSTERPGLKETMVELGNVFVDLFRKRHIIYYILFIILYRFAEGFVMKIVPLFLKADRANQGLGLSEEQIGLCYGTFGAAAFVIGSILAGYYVAHRGLQKSLFSLCCVFNLPFVAYTLLAIYQPESLWLIGGGIVLEYFGYGFGFVGLTLFMMQQIAPGKHQMAHYAFASGIMNLGVMLPGMLSGYVSDWLGYRDFFIFVLVCTIPAFLITWFVPFTYPDKK